MRLSLFSGIDRLLGFLFGLLRGMVLLGVFVILAQLLQLEAERWWRQSMLIPYGERSPTGCARWWARRTSRVRGEQA